jgi:hypothetical protein
VSGVSYQQVKGTSYQQQGAEAGPSHMFVSVDKLRTDVPRELGWYPYPGFNDVRLNGTQGPNGDTVWTGQFTLPAPRGSEPMRLVLREYERMPMDAALTPYVLTDRLVYADTVEI